MRKTLLVICAALIGQFTLSGQIVINEIIPPNTVEIRNLGGGTVNIGPYTLCQFPSYSQLSSISQVCGGDLMIEGGSLVAVTVGFTLNANDGELALYFMNGSFDNPGNMADYVEWGSHGHTRSGVAEAAGIWTDGDFVPSWTGCASLEYDGAGDASTDWVSQDMPTSPCMPNSLDGCGGASCMIAGAGLTNINCNDNGTPADPDDDFISFELNPTGVDIGNNYNVSVSSGSINPTSAPYGSPTEFQLQDGSAGAGNVTVTITDEDDPSCTFDVVITDPGSCSDACNISDAGLSGVFCNDAGTPSDDTDDFIMFNLDPDGLNLGTSYNVSVSSGTVMPTSADYGTLTTFDLNNGSAGSGDVTVTITDANDPSCTINVVVSDPGTCSDECEIVDAGLTDVDCDDNGTTIDSDDFITFILDPFGNNLDITYSVTVSSGTINPTSGTYGSAQFFNLNTGSAGGGNVTVTIIDDADPSCNLMVLIVDPGACSESCNLVSTGLSNVSCNDNGSPVDPSDDFISFSLNPTGSNLGTTYAVAVSAGGVTPTSGTYGVATSFTMNNGSAGAGNVTVTITDDVDPACMESALITDPGTCSAGCMISDAGLTMVACNHAGTPSNPNDDFISFNLNPQGMNVGTEYVVSVNMGTIAPDTASYGASVGFVTNNGSAGSGDLIVTITDVDDPNCTFQVTVSDPGTCSDLCEILSVGMNEMACNDNGTPEDNTDDFITFSLNPGGSNLSPDYTVTVSAGTISPDTAAYGSSTGFMMNPGSAGGGNFMLTVTDTGDPACTLSVLVVDPGSCSGECNLVASGLDSIDCANLGTMNPADDIITFVLNPSGSGLATNYNVTASSGIVNPATAPYGTTTAFALTPGTAGGGDVMLTITDAAEPMCTLNVTVADPGSCSDMPCEAAADAISTGSETMICTDEGVIDSVVVISDNSGAGTSSGWIVTSTSGEIMRLPAGGDTLILDFEGEPSGVCLIWRIRWDGVLSGLMVGQSVDTLDGCYDLSDSIAVIKLTGTECESAVFNPDLAQLISLYPNPTSGLIYIEASDVTIQRIRVLDVLGKTVMTDERLNPSGLDAGRLENGLYYVILETDRGWTLRRIAVNP